MSLIYCYFETRFAVVPMAEQVPRLLATILKAKEDPDHKIIVFFVAARIVQVSKSVCFFVINWLWPPRSILLYISTCSSLFFY